jgi:hypothetical protein
MSPAPSADKRCPDAKMSLLPACLPILCLYANEAVHNFVNEEVTNESFSWRKSDGIQGYCAGEAYPEYERFLRYSALHFVGPSMSALAYTELRGLSA